MKRVATLASWVVALMALALIHAQEQSVTWTSLVNVTVTGDVLQKTSGCDGCDDAGASSQQEISEGDGYIEFTVGETNTFWVGGLSQGNENTRFDDIDFAFRFNGTGWADVLEDGVYQSGGDTPYAAGDVFRVAVVGGAVQYSRNGTLLLESLKTPQYPLVLDTALGSLGTTVRQARLATTEPPSLPSSGGFVERAGSPTLRARFTRSQIETFLPPGGSKGAFIFPPPYRTQGIRLTDASDCAFGQDCVAYVGYSYWRNVNNHVGCPIMLIFLGMDRSRGGNGPALIGYNKVTDEVRTLWPLFEASSAYSYSTGEGWYFSATQPTKLYTYLVGGTELRQYDVLARQFEPTPAPDLRACPQPKACPSDAAYIFQPHSSDDDQVHSATVQNADFERLGCLVQRSSLRRSLYFPKSSGYTFDECHLDKSGRWLILLETKSTGADDNRIVDLRNGRITTIGDAQGGLGHLDMGFGYAVGADNYNALPNATVLMPFPVSSSVSPDGRVVHFNKRWDIVAANHVAHGNAIRAVGPNAQYACGSNASRVPDMADEIVCFSLDPGRNQDGSLDVLVVAQVLTDLDALGGNDLDGDDYEQMPKGNLDVTGRYFIWTTNMGGDRLDAFLVKVPADLLTGALPRSAQSTQSKGVRGTPSPIGRKRSF